MPLLDRFEAKVSPEPNSGCHIWTAQLLGGYGQFWFNGRMMPAHRYAYEATVGPIPEGLQIDHLCRVRCCVNPAHLEPVTQLENIRRGTVGAVNRARHLAKTHCKRGHPLEGSNLYPQPSGSRQCRICHIAAVRRYQKKNKVVAQ